MPEKRGYLGVMTQPLSTELGEYFGVKDGKGALVSEVVEGSPAAKLGLRAGDVITQIDDREVKGPGDLLRAMGDIDQEKAVKVTYVRAKKVRTGTAQVELRDAARGRHADVGRSFPRRFDRWLPPPGEMGNMDGMKSEMESLRKELDSLRMELQKMKEDLHRK
jgi:predicted metalloprotease with PDZ domain